jgi:hypothetical protein
LKVKAGKEGLERWSLTMTGYGVMLGIVIAAVAGSLLTDILRFLSHLPIFVRHSRIKTNPVNPDSAVVEMVFKDMQLFGLTKK